MHTGLQRDDAVPISGAIELPSEDPRGGNGILRFLGLISALKGEPSMWSGRDAAAPAPGLGLVTLKHSGVRRSHDPVPSFGLGHLDGRRECRSLYCLNQLGIAASRTARDSLLKLSDHGL